MRIAVVQHALRDTPKADADALAAAVRAATARGAELVVTPAMPEGRDATMLCDAARAAAGEVPVVCVDGGTARLPDASRVLAGAEALGPVLAVSGDACFDPALWSGALDARVAAVVMSPLSESDLQAEAALEVAIALSDALAGLVVVAECAGAELGEPGHGGSAVVLVGGVLAEAFGDDDVLLADVPVPVPQPEPREQLPEVPPILAQRLARHAGRRPDAGYLADLSDGVRRD